MNDGPTFLLPACPACSHAPRRGIHAGVEERPVWRYAHRTSEKRKVRCYFWTGCKHVEAVAPDATKNPISEGFAEIEARWRAAIPALLAERTARWPEGPRAELARFLDDRPFGISTSEHSAPATHEQRTNDKETSPQ